jgi:hypothetical protein
MSSVSVRVLNIYADAGNGTVKVWLGGALLACGTWSPVVCFRGSVLGCTTIRIPDTGVVLGK